MCDILLCSTSIIRQNKQGILGTYNSISKDTFVKFKNLSLFTSNAIILHTFYKENIMGVLIVIGLICLLIVTILYNSQKKTYKKQEIITKKRLKENEIRVQNSCKKLGVDYKQICTYNPGDISSLWGGPVTYPSLDYIDYVGCNFDDNAKSGTYCYWYDEKRDGIVFIGHTYGEEDKTEYFMSKENIIYYSNHEIISYTSDIKNEGKNISISGAAIGAVIAGGAGAIIGSRKDANKFSTEFVKHDDSKLYIYHKMQGEIKCLQIAQPSFYNWLKKYLPDKDYEYLQHNNNNINNSVDNVNNAKIENVENVDNNMDISLKLEKLKKLYENNVISEEEYEEQRSRLLNSI
jgi:predicted transcriptional regulator|nr:MAG TPA: Short C-terminal domain [Caudoviricetes sp.]